MTGSGTGDWETADWTNYQSLLAAANVLSPTDSSNDGADGPLRFPSHSVETAVWFPSNGVETAALPIAAGQTARGSEGSASAPPPRVPNGSDWRADAGERSGTGEQSSPVDDSFTSEGPAGASAAAESATDSPVTIANGATVDIDGPSVRSVTFAGTTGTLRLEDPQAFTGVISGLRGADAIDLSGLAYGANVKATYSGSATGGTLTVTDGAKTARIALSGNYLSSTWTLSSDGKGGTRVVDPTLPRGVTLQKIDGGPTYYASNGFTYAANAGWDNPDFIPIGPWEDMLLTQSDATRWKALGWNTAYTLTDNSLISLAASNGISVIQYSGPLPSGTGNETVGLLAADEPASYQIGVTGPIGSQPNAQQDGRFWELNLTWDAIVYGGLAGGPSTTAAVLDTPVPTPDGALRHIDATQVDVYFFAGARLPGNDAILNQGGLLDNLGQDMTVDQAARGSNYGDLISDERAYTGGSIPIWAVIEDGGPYTGDTSASDYITPPELNWAAWSSLIHGARGIEYFNHTFGGPAQTDDNLANTYYQTVQPGQTVSVYTQVQNTDALIEQLAPILNSPTALGYVTVNTPGYENGVVDSLFSGIELMAKDDNGQFYIFADTRDSETQTNISATFTLADKNATSVTVVGENRTIAVTNGVFTDTFATAATVHIYEVNDGGTGSTTPTITGISELPATGDLGVGKTVALTLAFSENVTVAGGAPTLTLNDGGTATYASGSGTSALTFNYTVAAGQSAASLAATALNLPSGVTIEDGAGNAANLSLSSLTQSGPQIDTTAPAAPVISGDTVRGNLATLNGTAAANSTITAYDNSTKLGTTTTNSSGAWTFTTGALASGSQSFTATATDGAGNVSPTSSALVVILTGAPAIIGISDSPATGDLNAGRTVALTVDFSENVTVAGGAPTLTLNDGGTATYASGSGTSALTFNYTVAAGQNTPDLMVAAVNLPSGVTIKDGVGNAANLSLAGLTQSSPQIDTTTPTITGISDSPATGDLGVRKTVALTLAFSEAVTVAGGAPTLTLNDGGTATYASGSGTSALTFNYTVAAGQNVASLAATALNLPSGVTIEDGAGNAANLSLSSLTQSGPQIDTTAPAAPVVSGDTVSGNVVTLNGRAAANSTITAYDNSTKLGTTTTNSSGAWTFTTGALASGSQSFTATATDGAGNVSPTSSALVVTVAGPLVTNGNFATDSFSGWTLGGNSTSTTYGPEIFIDTNAEGGKYAAGMGSVGSDGALSQTIATTAGQTYTLSFWLQNEAPGTNDFSAIWNGQTLVSLTDAAQSGYTQYTYSVTATGSTSTLEFSARNDPSQWDLDNVSLTAKATSPAPALTNGNFATDSFSGWTLGGNCTSMTYGPEIFIDTNAEGGSKYAAGMGSVGSDGALSQTIATTAGKRYTLSFWLQNDASGTNDFKAIWNGQTLLSLTDAAQFGYKEYTYSVTATGSASTLEFSARNDPSQWDLDNISLTANGTSSAAPIISAGAANSNDFVTYAANAAIDEVGGGSPADLLGRYGSAFAKPRSTPTSDALAFDAWTALGSSAGTFSGGFDFHHDGNAGGARDIGGVSVGWNGSTGHGPGSSS